MKTIQILIASWFLALAFVPSAVATETLFAQIALQNTVQKHSTSMRDQLASKDSCGRQGAACTWSRECCDGNCNSDGYCGTSFCKGNGESCNWNHNCCSGICNSGTCGLSDSGGCRAAGEACSWSRDCCDGNCNSDGYCGATWCKGNGESCNWNHNCCSNFCSTGGKCG